VEGGFEMSDMNVNLKDEFSSCLSAIWDYNFDALLIIDNSLKIIYKNYAANIMFEEFNKKEEATLTKLIDQLKIKEVLCQQKPKDDLEFFWEEKFLRAKTIPLSKKFCLVILKDLTRIKEAEDKIKVAEEINKEMNDIINLSADGLVSVDKNGILMRMNKAYEKIVGVSAEDFIGKPALTLKEKGYLPDLVSIHVMQDLKPKNLYLIVNEREVLLTGRPVFGDDGKLVRIVANIRDLTELNNLKGEIQKYNELTIRYETELKRLRAQKYKGELVGNSTELRGVMEMITIVADADSTVLIEGETGTGKEIVARMIHKNCRRKDAPFITINCGALSASLLESELFGYEPGAFTGADKKGKVGLFEAAAGGTLFLDEIGEMPIEMQAKLLRAIEEKKIRRIGSNEERVVDIRILAATNKDLKTMVDAGLFREDLFYRLNVIRIFVPPLRERKEDIPELMWHFLKKFNQQYGTKTVISGELVTKFMSYNWPGNVRQLENTIERLVVLRRGSTLDMESIADDIIFPGDQILTEKTLKEILEEKERDVILHTYEKHKSTRETARRLGVSQPTIVRKLQKYKVGIF